MTTNIVEFKEEDTHIPLFRVNWQNISGGQWALLSKALEIPISFDSAIPFLWIYSKDSEDGNRDVHEKMDQTAHK